MDAGGSVVTPQMWLSEIVIGDVVARDLKERGQASNSSNYYILVCILGKINLISINSKNVIIDQ